MLSRFALASLNGVSSYHREYKMTRTVNLPRKTVILTADTDTIQTLLNDALLENGLGEKTGIENKEEFLGSEKQEQTHLLAKIKIFFEKIVDRPQGGYSKIYPFQTYVLDVPAHKLYENWLKNPIRHSSLLISGFLQFLINIQRIIQQIVWSNCQLSILN